MKCVIHQASRCGGRANNEDRVAFVQHDDVVLLVLADGMGGHSEGEVAASLLVQVITGLFQARAEIGVLDASQFLLDSIHAANDAINEYGLRKRLLDLPRTTCVVCLLQNGEACWAHVGDSRLYHFSRDGLLFRTRDHSAVQKLFDQGLISEGEMSTHPRRNRLHNAVGGYMLPDIELSHTVPLFSGDVLLLCTDGIWPELTAAEMFSNLQAYPLERAVDLIMDHAEFRAGPSGDNLSMVALRYGEEMASPGCFNLETDFSLQGESLKPPDETDLALDRVLAEIEAALEKNGKK
jgi:serine/threonine protein phosphatase PrpC